MKRRAGLAISFWACCCAGALATPRMAAAQAAPGPMHPASSSAAASSDKSTGEGDVSYRRSPPPRPAAKTDLAGTWKFDQDQSDDIREKLKEARQGSGGRDPDATSRGGGNPNGGGSNPGGIHVGGMGSPYPGSGGGNNGGGNPRSGGANGSPSSELSTSNTQIQEYTYPAATLTLSMKDNEVDLKDDQGRVRTFYTDDRKVDRSKDAKPDDPRAYDAYWEDVKLVAKDDLAHSVRVTRSLEPAPGGKQLYQTVVIETNHSNGYVELRYTYERVGDVPPVPKAAAQPQTANGAIKSDTTAPAAGTPIKSDTTAPANSVPDQAGDRPTLKRPTNPN